MPTLTTTTPTTMEATLPTSQADTHQTADEAPSRTAAPSPDAPDALSPQVEATDLRTRSRNWWASRVHCTGLRADQGMSTAEYAVGTIAACAFAALLFKIVSSPEVQEMLSNLIDRALKTVG
ncbi:hypothetical protein GCM10009560_39690 [Nonomuraea longicatena]|uniref:DUF4244 domain-containing protein n=1 Tax=Nonomuraea longicatena TaxID=83682 RepID=A0ABP4ABV3_9ACTN